MTHWLTVQRVAWVILFAVLLIGLCVLFVPKVNELRGLHRERLLRQQENTQLQASIEELRSNTERFQNDPAFVERKARDIGMVKPGEVKVIVKDTNETAGQSQEPPNDKPRRR